MPSKRLRCDCGTRLALNRGHVGRTVRCPKCGLGWQVSEKDFQTGPAAKSGASTGRRVAIGSAILLLLALLLLCWPRGGDSQRGNDLAGQGSASATADSRSNLASDLAGSQSGAEENRSAASARPAAGNGDEPYALFAGVGQAQAPKDAPVAPSAPPAMPTPAAAEGEAGTETPTTAEIGTITPVDTPTPTDQPQETKSESESKPAQEQKDEPSSTSTETTRRPTRDDPGGASRSWPPDGRGGGRTPANRGGNNRGGRGGRGR